VAGRKFHASFAALRRSVTSLGLQTIVMIDNELRKKQHTTVVFVIFKLNKLTSIIFEETEIFPLSSVTVYCPIRLLSLPLLLVGPSWTLLWSGETTNIGITIILLQNFFIRVLSLIGLLF